MTNPLQCPKCQTVLTSANYLANHLKKPPKYCKRAAEQRLRSQQARRSTTPTTQQRASQKDLPARLAELRELVHLPDHIPKSVRVIVAEALNSTLENVASSNSIEAWTDLLVFSYATLGQPKAAPGERSDMTYPNVIRQNLQQKNPPEANQGEPRRQAQPATDPEDPVRLRKRVSRKLQDGNVAGAVQQLVSEESVMPPSDDTYSQLLGKHPQNPSNVQPPSGVATPLPPPVTPAEILEAIRAFPNGSAAGPDGMRPQYLKELTTVKNQETTKKLYSSLAGVTNIMLRGEVPLEIAKILYGANLFAFKKKDGGTRPIAVGTALRRIMSRTVSFRSSHLNSVLQPVQLGFATKGGAEAAVHGARYFIEDAINGDRPQVFLKLDVKNAFNSLDRNRILEATEEFLPAYSLYVRQCYGEPSVLLHGGYQISSQAGIQQGDPLGPLLYCLATIGPHKNLKSKLKESFLDDDALGGDPDDVYDDLCFLKEELEMRGLALNIAKCELAVVGGTEDERQAVITAFLQSFPDLQCPQLGELQYLGAPLHDAAVAGALTTATAQIARIVRRLKLLPAHHALYLLKCSMGPRGLLTEFDVMIRECLSAITNVNITDVNWVQASLPVAEGGLGIRSIEKLALPAFLASAYSVTRLATEITDFDPEVYCGTAEAEWQRVTEADLPAVEARKFQKMWDEPVIQTSVKMLSEKAQSDISSQARLLGVSTKDNGAWLDALPTASLGNLLNDSALRIAVGLRLGTPIVTPHRCICSEWVDARGYHGLSCKKSRGRKSRHSSLNATLKRAFASATIETELEPLGISRTNGKRPDGVTLVPWERGELGVPPAQLVVQPGRVVD
ncbi:uncharacterized protein LOC129598964 [Paramacrobiotus metropolitanus]|uniref:uncharacterized protein LOC129598964 n=1 Tax=Paramacrobiotus metropolitanus TaxID=2943436 RepID=UPI00244621BE|nr:uncharacterized protein LOC129598964 [Paramacrobiotus metropolitanus]